MVSWFFYMHSISTQVFWYFGFMVYLSISVQMLIGFMVLWFHGYIVYLFMHSISGQRVAARFLVFLVSWFCGFMVYLHALHLWSLHGEMLTGSLVSCTPSLDWRLLKILTILVLPPPRFLEVLYSCRMFWIFREESLFETTCDGGRPFGEYSF